MQVKNRLRYVEFKLKYGNTELREIIFQCAEDWGVLLEDSMAQVPHTPPHQVIASQAGHCRTIAADVDGITPFALKMATNVLLEHWVHGRALRKWFHKQPQQALSTYVEAREPAPLDENPAR